MNIATLIDNEDMDEEESKLVVVDNPVLHIAVYSDKSFVVFGDATKTFKNQLKTLGGKFNGRLKEKPDFPGGPAWLFFLSNKDKVIEFVNKVNTGRQQIQSEIPVNNSSALPTVVGPAGKKKFQYVKWKLFKPDTGMVVSIKGNGVEIQGKIIETESHKDIVDTAYIDVGGKTSKLVICNGKWAVWGYMVDHTVFFNDFAGSPESPSAMVMDDDLANI